MVDTVLHLALIPPLPSEVSLNTLKIAYGPGLTEILRGITAASSSTRSHLDIGVLCEEQESIVTDPRGSTYSHLQLGLSSLYSLICHISAQTPELDLEQKTDYRILLVYNGKQDREYFSLPFQGPVVTLRALASAQRRWVNIYALEGERGESILQAFSDTRKSLPQSQGLAVFKVHRVMGGTGLKTVSEPSQRLPGTSNKRHCSVAVGGTFDHLHAGHKLLLTATALILEPWRESAKEQERTLTVGITGDALLTKKKYAEILESWEQRQAAVTEFLSALLDLNRPPDNLEGRRFGGSEPNANRIHYKFDGNLTIKCVEISDPFGPTITDEEISALVVSGETRSGGEAVNDKRVEKGWPSLEVFEISVLNERAEDEPDVTVLEGFQSKISSTAIRKRLWEHKMSK
ncbi:MAG: hypothetical protein LQ340_004330 [Diploschistes diacapsis]|nr:MAG: hypothetical protein LQ340_004330 [Diploschistes diacapsis]